MKLVVRKWTAWNRASLRERIQSDKFQLIHAAKVAIALSLTALFILLTKDVEYVSDNGTWAIMTVVFVFEFTAGGLHSKVLNRFLGTLMGGILVIGAGMLVSAFTSKIAQNIAICSLILCVASISTYMRFLPKIKGRAEYGVTIFMLTFSFLIIPVVASNDPLKLASSRLLMVAIGSLIAIATSLLCPIWAGDQLYEQLAKNLDILAGCLESSLQHYVPQTDMKSETPAVYKAYLNLLVSTKTTEENLAHFASLEPPHNGFKSLKYPSNESLSVGTSLRSCAYNLLALHGSLAYEPQFPCEIRAKMEILTRTAGELLSELGNNIKTMQRSKSANHLLIVMQNTVEELQDMLETDFASIISLSRSSPHRLNRLCSDNESKSPQSTCYLVTSVLLLIESAARVKHIAQAVETLGKAAGFKTPSVEEDDLSKNHTSECSCCSSIAVNIAT